MQPPHSLQQYLRAPGTEQQANEHALQVCHTGGLRQLLPSFVPSFLFGTPSALVDLAVDDSRHILYARTQTSGLQVGLCMMPYSLLWTGKAVARREGIIIRNAQQIVSAACWFHCKSKTALCACGDVLAQG